MSLDYIRVVLNARATLEYSLGAMPMLLIPVIAWRAGSLPRAGDHPTAVAASAKGTRYSTSTPRGGAQ